MGNAIDSQDIWRTLDLGSHDFIFVVNRQDQVEYVNLSTAAAMECEPEEVIGKPWSSLFPVEHADRQLENLKKVFQSGQMVRVEEETVFPNKTLWLDTRLCPVKGLDGSTVAVLGVARDITKLKRTERAFKSSQHRLSTVLGNLPDMAYRRRSDDEGTMEFVSTGCFELTGHPPEDLAQSRKVTYLSLIHPDDRESVLNQVHEALAQRKPYNLTYRLITKKGKQKWVWEQGRGIFSSTKGLRALEGFVMDITARKRTEDALTDSEKRYRILFDECPAALARWDFAEIKKRLDALKVNGVQNIRAYLDAHPEQVTQCAALVNVLDVNNACIALFEAENREALRGNLQKLFSFETFDAFKEHLIAVAEGKSQFATELTARTLAGRKLRLFLNWAVAPGREETFREVLICVTDLTELRMAQAEADDRRREAILQREDSLAITGRLAAGIAHEINNPLQSIMTQLELLSGELPKEVRDGRRMSVVMSSIRQIAQITKGMLDLYRETETQAQECDFSKIAADVSSLAASSLQNRGVKVEVAASNPGLTVPLSPKNFSQILLNLILNASDAMPKGGVVRLEAQRTEKELLINVSDQGVGISPEDRVKVFDPFFTTKGAKGTGLGLTITHSLVKSGGGSIDIESEEGVGTVFHIRFPLADRKAQTG